MLYRYFLVFDTTFYLYECLCTPPHLIIEGENKIYVPHEINMNVIVMFM